MASRNFISLLAMTVLVALVFGPRAKAEIQCSDAVSQLLPCEPYLLGAGGIGPSASCCIAVQSLGKLATESAVDRKSMCRCFKQVASSMPINVAKARTLPDVCHVSIGAIQIDPNVNCDRI